MNNFFGYTRKQLENELIKIGEKPFRATQIFEWVYRKKIKSFDEMSNISKGSIENLKNNFAFDGLEIEIEHLSDDGTRKFLFKLHDGNFIETVLMRHNYGNSVCISTQVGCNMGCSFCASGLNKRVRNLEVHEMVLQVALVDEIMRQTDEKVSHVVVMGIGEPFDNYDNVMDFLRVVNDAKGLEIGARHMTVSTCGIVPKIYEFSEFELQVNLAISLHFTNDELRSQHMLINRAHNINDLFKSLDYYFEKTGRRITFEYVLMDGINDTLDHARELVNLVRGMNCYINLIPMNSTSQILRRSSNENMNKFYDYVARNKVPVTLRKEQGHDINAACGQLRIQRELK